MFCPVGMYLPKPVKITIDQGSPISVPYTWCLTNTCIAGAVADPGMVKEMGSGQTLQLEFVDFEPVDTHDVAAAWPVRLRATRARRRRRLIEQEQVGPAHERLREVEPHPPAAGKRAYGIVMASCRKTQTAMKLDARARAA